MLWSLLFRLAAIVVVVVVVIVVIVIVVIDIVVIDIVALVVTDVGVGVVDVVSVVAAVVLFSFCAQHPCRAGAQKPLRGHGFARVCNKSHGSTGILFCFPPRSRRSIELV